MTTAMAYRVEHRERWNREFGACSANAVCFSVLETHCKVISRDRSVFYEYRSSTAKCPNKLFKK
jgi:hypothetical protein